MIDAISLETAHLLGDALPSALRLRHRIFIERQKYDVPSHRGMEWDQFDTPAATYLLWRDEAAHVRAIARLIPTSLPYMIQRLWPELVSNGDMPSSDDIWEITRFGIDRGLGRDRRARVFGEMFCAFGEFGLRNGIGAYLFVTPAAVIDSALGDAGVTAERLGHSQRLGRLPVVAARSAVTHAALGKLRRYYGIAGPVLRMVGEVEAQAARRVSEPADGSRLDGGASVPRRTRPTARQLHFHPAATMGGPASGPIARLKFLPLPPKYDLAHK